MTHYECLGLPKDASRKDIRLAYRHLISITDKADTKALADIEEAYRILYDPLKRAIYREQLEEEAEGLEGQEKIVLRLKSCRLLHNPSAFNHYEFINQFLELSEESEDYLRPGQHLGWSDRRRLDSRLDTAATILHAESEGLRRLRRRNAEQQSRYELLVRNEKKITLCSFALASSAYEKYLYDLSLGPDIVPFTEDMQNIARLIGGWQQAAAYVRLYPHLNSAYALFFLRKAGCLTPANFKQLMKAADKEEQISHIASVIHTLADENLLNQINFTQVMAHSKFALALCNGLGYLAAAGLLEQQSFEVLLEAGQYADAVGSSWGTLKELNLLTPLNCEMINLCAAKNIGILLHKSFLHLEEQQLFTPGDGLDFLWTGDTEKLQALGLRIDEMFAYGISLLCHDKDKAETVFLLAIGLKKSLKNHYSKPLEEQRTTEQQFKTEFTQCLHSQDAAMSDHRDYWKVITANIAIALTGVGLLALGVQYFKTGHCFFEQTKRQQLLGTIEESWLQQDNRISV
jgi:hypothetical protein